MNKKLLLSIVILFTFPGCDLINKEYKRFEDRVQKEYERFEDQFSDNNVEDIKEEQSFKVLFQADENQKTILIPSQCDNNQVLKHIYFATQAEAKNNIFTAIKNLYSYPHQNILKPFWDLRYTNPVGVYIDQSNATYFPNHASLTGLDARRGRQNITVGSSFSEVDTSGVVSQSKCVNGIIAAGTTLNLNDAPEQDLTYAGIASTFTYQIAIDNHIKPWNSSQKGNLMIQAYFDTPVYHNLEKNVGGNISFNVFLHNPKIQKNLNFVIGLYAYGEGWKEEKADIMYDPTTNVIHVATVAKDGTFWSTKSPKSQETTKVDNLPKKITRDDRQWSDFFRVNLSYQNLLAVLSEMKNNPPEEVAGENFGLSPQDWELTLVAIQYELEEEGGKALVSGSFYNFQTYQSQDPL